MVVVPFGQTCLHLPSYTNFVVALEGKSKYFFVANLVHIRGGSPNISSTYVLNNLNDSDNLVSLMCMTKFDIIMIFVLH